MIEMRGDVTDAGQTTNNEQQLKIELLSQWKLEAESRNFLLCPNFRGGVKPVGSNYQKNYRLPDRIGRSELDPSFLTQTLKQGFRIF